MNVSPCTSCKHFNVDVREENVCTAFPDGIPREIFFGYNQHRGPVDGDHGIHWEPVEGMEWMDVPMTEGTEKPQKGVI